MFHRIGPAAYKADLSNTVALMDMTGHPYRSFPSIHIAGTNGKGSTSHMLAAVLQEAGYKVGLYTSPHLLDFRERIRVNGVMIPQEEVVRFVEEYHQVFTSVQPSFFEWTVALAFSFFRDQSVDIAVIETGLGGRLDSTNVITPEVSIITNIGWDHANLLGDTLQKIAGEKAGIIKRYVPVVIGERSQETEEVFSSSAEKSEAPLFFASDRYRIRTIASSLEDQRVEVVSSLNATSFQLTIDLPGSYQLKNLATVLSGIDVLVSKGWKIPAEAVASGLLNVRSLTGLAGRWQLLRKSPPVIADVGHNEHGLQEVIKQLSGLNYRNLHIVIGMVRDKDVARVLKCFPVDAHYHFCEPALPRALPVEELRSQAGILGLTGSAHASVAMAVQSALSAAEPEDLILIIGSTFVVAEALPLFREA